MLCYFNFWQIRKKVIFFQIYDSTSYCITLQEKRFSVIFNESYIFKSTKALHGLVSWIWLHMKCRNEGLWTKSIYPFIYLHQFTDLPIYNFQILPSNHQMSTVKKIKKLNWAIISPSTNLHEDGLRTVMLYNFHMTKEGCQFSPFWCLCCYFWAQSSKQSHLFISPSEIVLLTTFFLNSERLWGNVCR